MLRIPSIYFKLAPSGTLYLPARNRTFNTRIPRPPHWEFNQIQAGVRLKLPKPYDDKFPAFLKCRKQFENQLNALNKETEENPYERIIANELKVHFDNASMVLLGHANAMTSTQKREVWVKFQKENMEFCYRGRQTIGMAAEKSKFDLIMTFFQKDVSTYLIISPVVDLKVVYKILKSYPAVILMAGIIDDRLLRRHQLDELSKLDGINDIRAQLVHTMGSVATQFVQNLIHHQLMTVASLDKYMEIRNSKSTDSKHGEANDEP